MNIRKTVGLLVAIAFFSALTAAQTAPASSAAAKCAELLKLKVENTSVTKAEYQPDGTPVILAVFGPPLQIKSPAHCLVQGEVNHHRGKDGRDYGDKFEIRMPDNWSGRLLFQGGGGLDGLLLPALGSDMMLMKSADPRTALERGYAVISTDGGHQAANFMDLDASFGSDPDARADYNYRSTRIVTDAARKYIAQFYGRAAHHSYFKGCSNGGREALIAVQRYPEYFDGVVAGAPAFNLTHAAIAQAWATVQFAQIAPKDARGNPDLPRAMSKSDLELIANGVLKACDELDGLKDGLIGNPEACHFDPTVLQCAGEKADSCLSKEQVSAVKKVFAGPKNSKGQALYSDWPYDAGVADDQWRMWILGNGQMPALNVMIFPAFMNGVALAGVPPPVDIFKFNFDTDPVRMEKSSEEINATSADLSGFRKRGGKLLLFNGMSDPVFSSHDLTRYYKEIAARNGGTENTSSFARLFLVPGMTHCGGGPGVNSFDALTLVQNWVEKGEAPDQMIGSGGAAPGRTYPLCPYPKIAKYKGTGNPNEASSFSCELPK